METCMRLTHGVRHWKETTFVDDLGKLTQSCTNLAESVSPPVAIGGTCAWQSLVNVNCLLLALLP